MTLVEKRPGTGGADGIALWRQIADALREDIRKGRYASGERLPADTDLAHVFGVNRHTLRRALAVLSQEGLIASHRGKGTFVNAHAERIPYPIGQRTRFSEIIATQNREPRGRMIAQARRASDAELSRRLKVPLGSELIELETLYMVDGAPVSVTTSWFAAVRFPDLVPVYAETGSLTAALTHHGAGGYMRLETNVTAGLADTADAHLLGLQHGQPVLIVESVNGLGDDDPIQLSRARMAGDRVELVIKSGTGKTP